MRKFFRVEKEVSYKDVTKDSECKSTLAVELHTCSRGMTDRVSNEIEKPGRMSTTMAQQRYSNQSKDNRGNSNMENKRICEISCFYANARSIVNKLDEFKLYLIDEKPDVVGLTETWLHEDIEDSSLNFEGYDIFRRDREIGVKTRGGGVLLLVKEELCATLRSDIKSSKFQESVWCNIGNGQDTVLIGICYRAPDSKEENDKDLVKILDVASKETTVILGDFNFPNIRWECEEELDDSHFFIKCINNNFLYQKVMTATRAENILDLVLVTDENMVDEIDVGEPLANSDHCILRFDIKVRCDKESNSKKVMFDYFKADYSVVRQRLKNMTGFCTSATEDVETAWTDFKSVLLDVRDQCIKRKQVKNRKKSSWVTKDVIRGIRAKAKAWKKYRSSDRNLQLYEQYKVKLGLAKRAITEAKKKFEADLALKAKKNSKTFFAYVNSKKKVQNSIGPVKDELGSLVSDDRRCADIFNRYFSSVFTQENCNLVPDPNRLYQGDKKDELSCVAINEEIVERKLSELNVNKSPGSDGLHPKFLFEIRKEISKPLARIYNLSVLQGKVPTDWKYAEVTPIFKKGSKSDVKNYRPISLTSVLCKVLESIIKDSMVNHLQKYKLIRDSQHGFMKGRSCLTNLLDFFEEVTVQLDIGNPVDIIYLDFAKAFDKVPHRRLIKKIAAHGIGGKLLNWTEDWLNDRTQCVKINGTLSKVETVLSGVPQGSVLGPLLFTIYINDIDETVVSKLVKFADDSKLCKGVNEEEDVNQLRSDMNKLFKWSVDWQMLFNVDKCAVIHVGKNNKHNKYQIGDEEIKSSGKERDLGVIINDNGKSSEQCVVAARSANRMLGLIKRTICHKNKDTMVRLYKALVRPKLEYCVQAWCPYLKKDVATLERVQKRATRMILGLGKLDYNERLKQCGLISLEKRRVRGDLIQVFKMIKGIDGVDYRNYFQLSNERRTRGHSLKLVKTRSHLELRRNFFSLRIIDNWNKLPQAVVDADTVNSFKNRLDKYSNYD